MKKTRIAGLLLSVACASVLASCGNPEQEKAACEAALKKSICTVTSSGTPLQVGSKTVLSGDNNDVLTLTTKQVVKVDGNSYTVELAWTWAEEFNNLLTKKPVNNDETHEKLYFNYPAKAEQENGLDAKFQVEAKTGSQSANGEYSVHLDPQTIKYDEMTIAEFYKQKEGAETFAFMNDEGRISTNYGQDYYYVALSGKLVYKSPDNNFGILADGDKYVQLYHIDYYSDPAAVVVGGYYKAYGDISQYNGNIQIAYLNKFEELDDHSNIAEPTLVTVTNDVNNKGTEGFKPFYSPVANSIITGLSGVVSNPKDKDGNTCTFADFTGSQRFTFDLTLDNGQVITVAYNYHVGSTNTDAGSATRDAFKTVLNAAVSGTTKLTVKGSLQYCNSTNSIGGDGAWQIVPLEAGDIVVA